MSPYRSYNLRVLGPRISAKESMERLRHDNRLLLAVSSFSTGLAVLLVFLDGPKLLAWPNLFLLVTWLLRIRKNHRNYKRLARVIMARFKRKIDNGSITPEFIDEVMRALA